jgi:hypothetical protein
MGVTGPIVTFGFPHPNLHRQRFPRGHEGCLGAGDASLFADGLAVRGRLSGTTHLMVETGDLVADRMVGESARPTPVSGAPGGVGDRVILNVAAPAEWKAQVDRLITAS